ncbi:MAG: hypothetical protein U5Q16_04715 [Gammaproteobacteria bacterium]|nr:hypothetical protein [Gammaproteobacteria bacterium]
MNLQKLREAESLFLLRYPGGFEHEDMQRIGRKHNVGRLADFAATALGKDRFRNQGQVLDDIVKIVARSSMVSMFEKPKFRDCVNGLNRDDRSLLANGFKALLHGRQEQGFNNVVDVLADARLAKWSLLTACLFYYHPQTEVFIKPTTTKNVIRQFEFEALTYRPRPTWDFYAGYRDAIETMKSHVDPSLSPNNAAFTGFLMMSTAVDH